MEKYGRVLKVWIRGSLKQKCSLQTLAYVRLEVVPFFFSGDFCQERLRVPDGGGSAAGARGGCLHFWTWGHATSAS